MATEADPVLKLRAKLDELEAHVRQCLGSAVDRTSLPQPWSTLIKNRDTLPRVPPRPLNAAPGEPQITPESFLSRIARFFGGGR